MVEPRFKFKIITAGDGNVGKTTLLHRFIEGKFLFESKLTIGVDIFHKMISLSNQIMCSLQLWDLGGQEKFRNLLDSFVKTADGAILMYDLTNQNSFDNLRDWEALVRKYNPELPIILVGSKLDLSDLIKVKDQNAHEFLQENNIDHFYKTSSKTGHNIDEVFETLTKLIIKKRNLMAKDQSIEI